MRRFLLAAVASLALVTGAVTAEPWRLTVDVVADGVPAHTLQYVHDGKLVLFASKAQCEEFLAEAAFVAGVRVPVEADEIDEHGQSTKFTWGCVPVPVPGTDI